VCDVVLVVCRFFMLLVGSQHAYAELVSRFLRLGTEGPSKKYGREHVKDPARPQDIARDIPTVHVFHP